MNLMQAARKIQREQCIPWHAALTWAHQCQREAKRVARAEEDRKRSDYFEQFKERQFLKKLRDAKKITPMDIAKKRAVTRSGSALGGGIGWEVHVSKAA